MDLLAAYSDSELDSEPEFIDEQPDFQVDEKEEIQNNDDSDSDDDFGPKLPPPSSSTTTSSSSSSSFSTTSKSIKSIYSSLSPSEIIEKFNIPLHKYILLETDHTKACNTISMDANGTSLISGSYDYSLNFFDFSSFDSKFSIFDKHSESFFNNIILKNENNFDTSTISLTFKKFLKYCKKTIPNDGQIIHQISFPQVTSNDTTQSTSTNTSITSPLQITSSHYILTTNTSHFYLYDFNDCGTEIFKSVKGDMYLRDLNNTKGHLMEITDHFFHPLHNNIFFTSSLDSTIRIWDLENGKRSFNNLICSHIIKYKSTLSSVSMFQNTSSSSSSSSSSNSLSSFNYNRIHIHSLAINPNGDYLFASGSDGMIQIWKINSTTFTPSSRTEFVLKPPHIVELLENKDKEKDPIIHFATSLAVSPDGRFLIARYTTLSQCIIWKLPKIFHTKSMESIDDSISFNNSSPVIHKVIENVPHISTDTNVEISPDSKSFAVCTIDFNPKILKNYIDNNYNEEEEEMKKKLIFNIKNNYYEGSKLKIFDIINKNETKPIININLNNNINIINDNNDDIILNKLKNYYYGIKLIWNNKKNILLISLSNGKILLNYSILSSNLLKKEYYQLLNKTKKIKSDSYYYDTNTDITKLIREEDIRAPIQENIEREKKEKKIKLLKKENKFYESGPAKPSNYLDFNEKKTLSNENAKYSMKLMKKDIENDSDNDDDPRKKLFKYHQEEDDNLSNAYKGNVKILHHKTLEEEEEEFKKLRGKN